MKKLFIINPISGRGKDNSRAKLIRQVQEAYSTDTTAFQLKIWEKADQLAEIVSEASANHYEAVIAVGGDGTIHEIAQHVIKTDMALGVIPLGSGNGFARHLGYSRNVKKAFKQVENSQQVIIDVGKLGENAFLNVAGIGIDAEVANQFAKAKRRGLQTYVQIGARIFQQFKPFDGELVIDGNEAISLQDLLLLDIANGTEWGNGAKIAPQSSINDGELEVILLRKAKLIEVPALLTMLFLGTIHKHPAVEIRKGKSFEVHLSREVPAHLDGEPIGSGRAFTCKIEAKALKLLVPEDAEEI